MIIPVVTERHASVPYKLLTCRIISASTRPNPSPINYTSSITLGRLYVEHVVKAPVSDSTLEDIEDGQFARLFNPRQVPVSHKEIHVGERMASVTNHSRH
jgi:hypothetical protein